MLVGRLSQYFKFLIIAIVAIIFIMAATKQAISRTFSDEQMVFKDQRADFIKQAEQELLNNKDDSNKNNVIMELQEENLEIVEDDDTQLLFNDRMPGAYLRFNEPAKTNKSYCKYNYELPYDLIYTGKISSSSPELGKNSPYRIIYNVTEAYDTQNASQVTYASHMTANFAYYIPELLRSWDGLITITAFVPDLDTAFFLEQVNQFCYCEPEMYRVSIHIVTHKTIPVSKKDVYFDRPDNCVPQDSSRIAIYQDFEDTITYPVNVLRNVARTSALTKYVLVSDAELMPSKGLATGFLKMIEKYNTTNKKEVFVLPIFEVDETSFIPENKEELFRLVEERRAVYFHELVCKHCQMFPGVEEWLSNGFSNEIKPFVSVKRQEPYHRWEPLFIGTNNEPLYNENLSWEGLQDKMTQSLEMCLQDYNFTILDNAFLVHWPGIKREKVVLEEWRTDYILENKVFYKEIITALQSKYPDIPGCMVNLNAFEQLLGKTKNDTR